MTARSKISPAFAAYLQEAERDGRMADAIVLYRPERPAKPAQTLGRLGALQARLAAVEDLSSGNQAAGRSLLQAYRKDVRGPRGRHLRTEVVGRGALPVARVEINRDGIEALADRPEVLGVLPNQRIRLVRPKAIDQDKLLPGESQAGLTWGLQQLDIPPLWPETTGEGVVVGVLDTGVYGDHGALRRRVDGFVLIDPLGRRIEPPRTFDGGLHGTHVCGTIAGGKVRDIAIGVAPGAALAVAAVLVGDATLRTLIEGIEWAVVDRGARILNLSLGVAHYEPLFPILFAPLIEQFDVLPVAAVGNENHGNTASPGSAWNALAVGAAERPADRPLSIAPFSCGASLVFPGQVPAYVHKPDVAAPGVDVLSCIPPQEPGNDAYAYLDGSSMAAPHGAGAAALLMAAKPGASATDVAQALKDTAHHPDGDAARPDNRWGHGFIRPRDALGSL